ncbi:MAG: type II toxin-antitoxin system VapB family antitoxin [Rhizobiaceae bacterium]
MCMFVLVHTHWAFAMRTNIDIDDELMAEAMKVTGMKTKRETVQKALEDIVLANRRRQAIQAMRGLGWEGDLEKMRTDDTRDLNWGFAEDRK